MTPSFLSGTKTVQYDMERELILRARQLKDTVQGEPTDAQLAALDALLGDALAIEDQDRATLLLRFLHQRARMPFRIPRLRNYDRIVERFLGVWEHDPRKWTDWHWPAEWDDLWEKQDG